MKRHLLLYLTIGFATGCAKKSDQKQPDLNPAAKEQTSLSGMNSGDQAGVREVVFKNSYVERNWPVEDEEDNEWTQEFKDAATPAEKIEVLGRKQATGPEQLASVIRASLREPNEGLRIEAAQTIMSLIDLPDEVPDLVMGAVNDPSSEVRAYAMESVNELHKKTQLEVYGATIGASDYEVRKTTIVELGRMHSKPAFEVLMQGLANEDAAFRDEVNFEINLMVNQKFESYEEAKNWWDGPGAVNFSDNMIDTGDDE
ncbi:MAG: hypothetical protein ACI9NC_002935 [Verrucomicrobiales bacterium]|jgi:hypothetical protein